MTTSYSMADTTLKDAGGAKLISWVDISTSQLDFSLPAGIGTKITSGKNYSALFAGTGLAGSKLETPTVGNLAMGALTVNPSAIAFGGAIPIRADDRGQMFTTALSSTTCAFIATSHDTITTNSGLLYSIWCAGCGVVAGTCVSVQNGTASLTAMVFSQNSETLREFRLQNGTCFGSLIVEKRNTSQPVFVTAEYRTYGLG